MSVKESKRTDPVSLWILLGIPVLCIAGSLMHFVYDWTGKSTVVGIFAPTNESVWEHLKLAFWPILLWWLIGYILLNKKSGVSPTRWFTSCSAAQLVCPLFILAFFYTYTGAFGIESLVLDILSLVLGVAAGQGLALHLFRRARPGRLCLYFSIIILLVLAAAFTVFTFLPPHVPVFADPLTGSYGI